MPGDEEKPDDTLMVGTNETNNMSSPRSVTAATTSPSEVNIAIENSSPNVGDDVIGDAGPTDVEVNTAAEDTVEDTAEDTVDGGPAIQSTVRPSRYRRCIVRRSRRAGSRRRGFVVSGLRDLQSRHGQWTCFFCCHVTTGTAIIGAWHVMLHVLALSLLCLAMLYPGLMNNNNNNNAPPINRDYHQFVAMTQDVKAVNCSFMPCALSTQHSSSNNYHAPRVSPDFPLSLGHLLSTHQLNSGEAEEAVSVAMFITLCTLLMTLLLLFGLHKKHASHLMPFFFLQVFDFCISSMTMVSYLSYLPNMHHLLQDTPAFPFRDQLLTMQRNCLTFAVMVIFLSTFMVKAYCINIVWRCYKYLLVCRAAAITGQSTASLLAAGRQVTARTPPPEHCVQWLHDYRSKVPGAYPEPPPSYDMAMAAFVATDEGGPHYSTAQVLPPDGSLSPPVPGASTTTTGVGYHPDDDSPLLPPYEVAVAGATHLVDGATYEVDMDPGALPRPHIEGAGATHPVDVAAYEVDMAPWALPRPPIEGAVAGATHHV